MIGSITYDRRGLPHSTHLEVGTSVDEPILREALYDQQRRNYENHFGCSALSLVRTETYDLRHRPLTTTWTRAATSGATLGELGAVTTISDLHYAWDERDPRRGPRRRGSSIRSGCDNLLQIDDQSDAEQWPDTQKPRRQTVEHVALYRVIGIEHDYRQGDDGYEANGQPYQDWRTEQAHQLGPDAQPILDEEAAAGRIKYVLENPKKAGLVRCFTEWPGFVAVAGLHEGEELETKHFDRSGWQLARRPKERERYWRKSRLKLSRLPGMESLSRAAYLATVKSWCDSRPVERCLGVEGVLDADVNQRPKKPKRSRRPYAFGRPECVDAYREVSGLRVAAYDAVRALAKIGERVEWPEGMYAPGGAVAA